MGRAIGDILPFAIGVAISPVPIIAIVLMLGTPRGRSTGPAFACGWVLGLTAVGGAMLVVASGNSTAGSGGPATWVNVLKLVFGALFLLLAVKQWRGRPHAGEPATMPKWMQTIDTFTAGKALAAGIVLSAVNPKNLALTVAAAAAIAQTGISTGQEIGALVVFILIASITILTPLVIYFTLGAKAADILDGIKGWMAANNATIMTVLLVVLGFKLIGDAISGFSS
jgi:threonine/homoserine/homoserine lactone efflux protein